MMATGGPGQQEGVLLTGLKDDPRVANNICFALHNLAEQLDEQRNAATNPLSPLFVTLARSLLEAADRPDAWTAGTGGPDPVQRGIRRSLHPAGAARPDL